MDNQTLLAEIKKLVLPLQEGQERAEKRFDNLEQGLAHINTRLGNVEQGQAQTNTALEAVAEGQKDIREQMATKADLMDLRSDLNKKIKNHEKRITTIEEDLELHHKN